MFFVLMIAKHQHEIRVRVKWKFAKAYQWELTVAGSALRCGNRVYMYESLLFEARPIDSSKC